MLIVKFRNPYIGSLATLARSLRATMEETTEDHTPESDAKFIDDYAKKMEKEEKDGADSKPPAKKLARAATAKEEDDDEDELEDEEVPGDDADDDAAVDAADDDADEEDSEDGADDADEDAKAKGKKDDDEEEVDDDEEDDDSTTEFDRAAKSAKLPTRLDDLPEEARPVVEKRLKDMEAGFNRVQQQATTFRQEQREFRAEERYRADHPAEFLASMLAKDPQLEEAVVTLLEKLRDDEDPSQREAATVLEREHRRKAAEEIAKVEKAEREQSEWLTTRSSEVESLARQACTKSGISFDRGVEAAIAYEIRDQGDIKNDRIKEIVDEMAQERGRSQRAVRREERKRVIQGKTEARKNASPLRAGTGRAGGSTRQNNGKERTLEENMTATAERLFPGQG